MARGIHNKTKEKILCDIKEKYYPVQIAFLRNNISISKMEYYIERSKSLQEEIEKAEGIRDAKLLDFVMTGTAKEATNAKWLLARVNSSQFSRPSVRERKKPKIKNETKYQPIIDDDPSYEFDESDYSNNEDDDDEYDYDESQYEPPVDHENIKHTER